MSGLEQGRGYSRSSIPLTPGVGTNDGVRRGRGSESWDATGRGDDRVGWVCRSDVEGSGRDYGGRVSPRLTTVRPWTGRPVIGWIPAVLGTGVVVHGPYRERSLTF